MRNLKSGFCSICLLIACCVSCVAMSQRCFKSIEEARQSGECVECLDLSRNRLESLPSELFEFKDLKRLILSRNRLSGGLDSLALLPKLRYLDLSSNYIESLPESLAFSSLDSLIMWDNPCYGFADCFSRLDLRYLDLRAIQMNRAEQKKIKAMFPNARIRMDHPCNCGARRE
ncbi:MAG: leucine-rich repeat domain-containing protein [Bacteroidales bacterium]|nr:leucine-rich repeat domain-containing protein [Bacteroidales bacterium]MEE0936786.1 leucine-rich repeat domain-containing protein [Bacteroidales bacterium]MEE1094392.1 leucine-rich repeat domain-containing protein [Bacteroidales bacterium]